MSRLRRRVVLGLSAVTVLALATAAPAVADRGARGKPPGDLPKVPLMIGSGGAVSTVDRDASQVGIDVLAKGGNAADAAIATAAALGVTEPYSAGIGGGGFFVYYDAKTKKVSTIDGRETAPKSFTRPGVHRPGHRPAVPLRDRRDLGPLGRDPRHAGAVGEGRQDVRDAEAPTSCCSLPSSLALKRVHGRPDLLRPDARPTRRASPSSRRRPRSSCPGATRRRSGRLSATPTWPQTYIQLARSGARRGSTTAQLGDAIVAEAQHPTTKPGDSVLSGQLTKADLQAYQALIKAPITSQYKGFDVYGMPVPSSGGIAVAEILNLVEAYEDKTGETLADQSSSEYLHWFSEASATAFADRNRYVGDVPSVPVSELISDGYAAERACPFDPNLAQNRPIPFGSPDGSYTSCAASGARQGQPYEGPSTTHLVTADKWGNVASYTLTIEQTGGSGITVPGYGFLLNNELTDFNFVPLTAGVPDPNLPGPGKRPRSSMSPTIVLKDGAPYLTVGSPGGATIITSVAQTLLGFLDRDLDLVDAIAAPRLSSRNGTREDAEPAIVNGPDGAALQVLGHQLNPVAEIGAVTAIHPLGGNAFESAAETVRRGGGSAMVVSPGTP